MRFSYLKIRIWRQQPKKRGAFQIFTVGGGISRGVSLAGVSTGHIRAYENPKYTQKHLILDMTNRQTIETFYTAFQKGDYSTMQSCYADSAVFNDPAFVNLAAPEVRAMWKMLLLSGGAGFSLEFSNIQATDTEGGAEWTARYVFSQTGRKVVNHIKASFVFENGKIIKHTDQFSFYRWSRQALGLPGLLLGHTGFLKRKVQTLARKRLDAFMQKEKG
jgi:ketosteroid isomerase-like protein